MLVEIAVQDVAGAEVAAEAGADRVELCTGLSTGGLTPSAGLIRAVVAVGLPVRVLIRSREGGFCYQHEEIELMANDISTARDLGAAGVVVGAQLPGPGPARLDRGALERFVAAAGELPTVLHRVSDLVGPDETAVALTETGIAAVLTSGGAPTVAEGIAGLGRLADRLGGDRIVAGGGLRAADLAGFAALGIGAVHASASHPGPDEQVGPGASAGRRVTAPALVRQLVETAQAVTG